MYKKLTRKEVTEEDIKEIWEFLSEIGWWNYIAFPSFVHCQKAWEFTQDIIDLLNKK
jgi:hypothetical protein